MLLLPLLLLPSVSSFLFGCNTCQQQPSYGYQQLSYYPSQPQYYPQQQPSYYPPPQPQGYVAPPHSYQSPSSVHRTPYRQYSIPESAYGGAPPGFQPNYRPALSRSGYGDDFLGEGSIPLRPSAEGEKATYIINRHGANSIIVHGEEPIRSLAPQSPVSQPFVDEVRVETNAPARQSVQVISVSQPVHPVEKLYRPTVHQVDVVPQTYEEPSPPAPPTYTSPSPSPSTSPSYQPTHVVESISEFSGQEPTAPSTTLAYPIEQQGYDSVTPSESIRPYEPATTPYSPPSHNELIQVPASVGYDGKKRFAGFNEDELRRSGIERRS